MEVKLGEVVIRESTFNTEIVNSIKWTGDFAYKLGDIPASVARGLRFVPDKPCDILACLMPGRFVAIECKQIKKWQGLNRGMLRDSQITALDHVVRRGGKAYLMVNVRIQPDTKKGQKRENWCVIFTWSKHRSQIVEGKYTAKEMRSRSVGVWRSSKMLCRKIPGRNAYTEPKRIWDLRGI